MSDDLKGLAARDNMRHKRGRIVRVVRALLPEIFDLKDKLVKACLDGEISEQEITDIEAAWHDLWHAIGQQKREETP